MSTESQTQSVQIHSLARDDIPRLRALADEMRHVKVLDYFERNFDFVKKGQRDILLITCGGADAGYCILNWKPKYGFFRKLKIPEFQDLSILPDMRRRGLATAMIEYCENAARHKGCAYMGLGVAVNSSFGPAQQLYTKLGYAPDGNGITYDRKPVAAGEMRPMDDQLCLMMIKTL